MLVIPKKPIASLAEVAAADADLLGHLVVVATELARSLDLARQHAQAAEQALDPSVDHDDRAVTHGRLAQAWTELGDSALAQQHQAQAQAAWGAFNTLQADWRAQLQARGLQAQAAA